MTGGMRSRSLHALLALSLTSLPATAVGAPETKAAGKKTPPACGARALPLVVGNSWTYKPSSPRTPEGLEIRVDPTLTKFVPKQPEQVVITVTAIETKGPETVVSLEEKSTYSITVEKKDKGPATAGSKTPVTATSTHELVVKSAITCSKTKFELDPRSFLFSGEPGGVRELELDTITRTKDTSWKLANGVIGENPWREDLVAHFVRTPIPASGAKLGGGKLELERLFQPEVPENISVVSGEQYVQVDKFALVTSGRVVLDEPRAPNPQPTDLPAPPGSKGGLSRFWVKTDLGVVRVLNPFAHQYDLVAHTLN
jgi:hypothetical protein